MFICFVRHYRHCCMFWARRTAPSPDHQNAGMHAQLHIIHPAQHCQPSAKKVASPLHLLFWGLVKHRVQVCCTPGYVCTLPMLCSQKLGVGVGNSAAVFPLLLLAASENFILLRATLCTLEFRAQILWLSHFSFLFMFYVPVCRRFPPQI